MDNFGKRAIRPIRMKLGGSIGVRYAPVVSLSDGSLFGYEAIPFDNHAKKTWAAARFFARSDKEEALYVNNGIFRELAIRGISAAVPRAVKLFLPVPVNADADPRIDPSDMMSQIEAAGLRPEQFVVQLNDEGERRNGTLREAVRQYRAQGFRIALSGLSVNRLSLERLVELKPDYVRIGEDWLPRSAKDPAGVCLLQAVSALARSEKIVLLADGIEREEHIRPLMSSGIAYGQGAWLGAGSDTPAPVDSRVTDRIRQEMRRKYRGTGALVELAEPACAFPSTTTVSEIARLFEAHREAPGFVIVENGKPVGMLMKEKLHRMLARQFGLPLYGSRPVSKIMDAQPLIVDESTPIEQLSQTAMAREPDNLYDAVIVTKNGEAIGIVSIRALLEWITNDRMSNAQWANPLTGLPGNEPIRRELSRRLDEERPFAVLYADLDHFKWYNDQYGFHRGDDVIRFTSEVLQDAVRKYSPEDGFVGHIGGDDFIAMIDYGNPVRMAEEMIASFENGVSSFLDKLHGPVVDRSGLALPGARLSLSLALLSCHDTRDWTPDRLAAYAAKLKKTAKGKPGSALEWETLTAYPADDDAGGIMS